MSNTIYTAYDFVTKPLWLQQLAAVKRLSVTGDIRGRSPGSLRYFFQQLANRPLIVAETCCETYLPVEILAEMRDIIDPLLCGNMQVPKATGYPTLWMSSIGTHLDLSRSQSNELPAKESNRMDILNHHVLHFIRIRDDGNISLCKVDQANNFKIIAIDGFYAHHVHNALQRFKAFVKRIKVEDLKYE